MKIMKKQLIIALMVASPLFYVACSGGKTESTETTTTETTTTTEPTEEAAGEYDPTRGEGKFDSSNVTLGALNADMAKSGKSIAETKCFSCHKTTDERLVGPGWKDVTKRRTAHWLMNFITDPDPMIDKDPEVQAQLETCLVRMPNQNLAEKEARDILEFMRQNDGAK